MFNHTLKIGLTGGIGSGKSIVSGLFRILDIPVYDSDARAKSLMTSDDELVESIKTVFGKQVYSPDHSLNRKLLSDIVFKDSEKLEQLNGLVHPVVMRDFGIWSGLQESAYVILESAILIETGIYKLLHKNICVYTPADLRISRIMKRDNISFEKAMERIKNQLIDAKKLQLSDYVIINDEKNSLIDQVLTFHNQVINN